MAGSSYYILTEVDMGLHQFVDDRSTLSLSLSGSPRGPVEVRISSESFTIYKNALPLQRLVFTNQTYATPRFVYLSAPPHSGRHYVQLCSISDDQYWFFSQRLVFTVHELDYVMMDAAYRPTVASRASASFQLALLAYSTQDVELSFTSSSPLLTIAPQSLTFPLGNWSLSQAVRLTAGKIPVGAPVLVSVSITANTPEIPVVNKEVMITPPPMPSLVFEPPVLTLTGVTVREVTVRWVSPPSELLDNASEARLFLSSVYPWVTITPSSLLFPVNRLNAPEMFTVTIRVSSDWNREFRPNLVVATTSSDIMELDAQKYALHAFVSSLTMLGRSPVVQLAHLFSLTLEIEFDSAVRIGRRDSLDTDCAVLFTMESMRLIGENSACSLLDSRRRTMLVLLDQEYTGLEPGDSLRFTFGAVGSLSDDYWSVILPFTVTAIPSAFISLARLSDDGRVLMAHFSEPIQPVVNNSLCSDYFLRSFDGSDCRVFHTGESSIQLNIGYYASIYPSQLRRRCGLHTSLISAEGRIRTVTGTPVSGCCVVDFPESPLVFLPTILGPSRVSRCAEVVTFFSGDVEKSFRSPFQFRWQIESPNYSVSSDSPALYDSVHMTNTSFLQLSTNDLRVNEEYILTAYVHAIFSGKVYVKSHSIFVVEGVVPMVTALFGSAQTARRDSDTELRLEFVFPNCTTRRLRDYYDQDSGDISVVWRSPQPWLNVDSLVQDNGRALVLPAFSMAVNSTVEVTYEVLYLGTMIHSGVARVRVAFTPFQFLLPDEVLIQVTQRLELDASGTLDPNQLPAPLSFSWESVDGFLSQSVVHGSVFSLPPNALVPTRNYSLRLVARSGLYMKDRLIHLIPLGFNDSSVWIEGSGELSDLTSLISLSARPVSDTTEYTWSLEECDEGLLTPKVSPTATLSPYCLVPGGTLTVHLTARSSTGPSRTYSRTIRTPMEPRFGWLTVLPAKGTSHSTLFILHTENWVGDGPLQYRFGYMINGREIYLQRDFSSKNYLITLLPQGTGAGSLLDMFVQVRSGYGAQVTSRSTSASTPAAVVVLPLVTNEAAIGALMDSWSCAATGSQQRCLIHFASSLLLLPDRCQFVSCLAGTCVQGRCLCNTGYTGASCDTHLPVDGRWGEWSDSPCLFGFQVRSRWCDSPAPRFGGLACEGLSIQSLSCNEEALDIPFWSQWTEWSPCDAVCGDNSGIQLGHLRRRRLCVNGDSCEGAAEESLPCQLDCGSYVKLCAGQERIDASVIGQECGGHGTCFRSTLQCDEDNFNCTAVCQCVPGFQGLRCSLQTSVYSSFAPRVAFHVADLLRSSFSSASSHSSLLSFLSLLSDYLDLTPLETQLSLLDHLDATLLSGMDMADLLNLQKLQTQSLQRLLLNGTVASRLSAQRVMESVRLDVKRVPPNLPVGTLYSFRSPSFLYNLKKAMSNRDLRVTLDSISVTVNLTSVRNDQDVPCDTEDVLLQTIHWNLWGDLGESRVVLAPFLSLSLSTVSPQGAVDMALNLSVPIELEGPISMMDYSGFATCLRYNASRGAYSPDGVMTMALWKDLTGHRILSCRSQRMSDFGVIADSPMPTMKEHKPVANADFHRSYSIYHPLGPYFLLGVVLVFLATLAVSFWRDRHQRFDILRERYMGYVASGEFGYTSTTRLTFLEWCSLILRRHLWLRPIFGRPRDLGVTSRSRATVILFSSLSLALFVGALFFPTNSAGPPKRMPVAMAMSLSMMLTGVLLRCFSALSDQLVDRNLYKQLRLGHKRIAAFRAAYFKRRLILGLSIANLTFYLLASLSSTIVLWQSYLFHLCFAALTVFTLSSIVVILLGRELSRWRFNSISFVSFLMVMLDVGCVGLGIYFENQMGYFWTNSPKGYIRRILMDIEQYDRCLGYRHYRDHPLHSLREPQFAAMDRIVGCVRATLNLPRITVITLAVLLMFCATIWSVMGVLAAQVSRRLRRSNEKLYDLSEAQLGAIDRLQRWIRYNPESVKMRRRRTDVRLWSKSHPRCSIIKTAVYLAAGTISLASLFLAGALTSSIGRRNTETWIFSCLSGFAMDVFFWEPVVLIIEFSTEFRLSHLLSAYLSSKD